MYKEIYKAIKKYDTIFISRHIGADSDALGSQIALKSIILETFPSKKVYTIGSYSNKFRFMGSLDRDITDIPSDSLLIVLDTPIISRIDDVFDINKFKYKIKIDHHPFEEKFCDIEYINENASSTCELICELCNNTKLKITKYAAERLYMGIISDTNRFMYPCSTSRTMVIAADLIEKYKIDKQELYENMYMKNINEIRFKGYIFQNLKITKHNVGYIYIDEDIQKEYDVDAASAGNIIGDLTFVNELIVWLTFSMDKKQDIIRVSVRSRGPAINTLAMEYNGGGHKLASGMKIKDVNEIEEIIDRFDELCKEYLEDLE